MEGGREGGCYRRSPERTPPAGESLSAPTWASAVPCPRYGRLNPDRPAQQQQKQRQKPNQTQESKISARTSIIPLASTWARLRQRLRMRYKVANDGATDPEDLVRGVGVVLRTEDDFRMHAKNPHLSAARAGLVSFRSC